MFVTKHVGKLEINHKVINDFYLLGSLFQALCLGDRHRSMLKIMGGEDIITRKALENVIHRKYFTALTFRLNHAHFCTRTIVT